MCKFEGCDGKVFAREMCGRHYHRWRKEQQTVECASEGCSRTARRVGLCDRCYEVKRLDAKPVCTFPGCNKPQYAHGLCSACYSRQKRRGTTERAYGKGKNARTAHPAYNQWAGMRKRCNNPNMTNYEYYGGQGIKVCERWDEFWNFVADMGEPPTPEHTIDRIKNDGDYEPSNCKWSTQGEQSKNKRNVVVTVPLVKEIKARYAAGEKCFRIAKSLGLNYQTVNSIVNRQSWKDVEPTIPD